jgi:hypothetical protein
MSPKIQTQALALPIEQRALLAMALLGSLDDDRAPPEAISQAWLDVAAQRAHQIDSGEVELISYDVVRAQAKALCR